MPEPLFTEAQWRAIDRVEAYTSNNHWISTRGYPFKEVIAPHLSRGRFLVCWYPEYLDPKLFGPPEYRFVVYEERSELVLASALEYPFVLEVARETANLIGAARLTAMVSAAAEAAEVRRAERETSAAIAKAKRQPRKITKRAKAVFEASEGKCHYCGTVLTLDGRWHIEHKFPRALFGGSEQENLVAACAPCNHAKRDKTDLEFKALLASKEA